MGLTPPLCDQGTSMPLGVGAAICLASPPRMTLYCLELAREEGFEGR